MRLPLPKLPFLRSSKIRFFSAPRESVIRTLMAKALESEADAAATSLQAQTDAAVQAILNDSDSPALQEINALKARINGLYADRQIQLDQRKAVILQKVLGFNSTLERYKALIARYEVLRPEIDVLVAETNSRIEALDQENNGLATELVRIAQSLEPQLEELNVAITRLNAYLEAIRNGTEPTAQEIEKIQDEFNALVESTNALLEQEFQRVKAIGQELDTWIEDQNQYLNGLGSDVNDAAAVYNNFLETVRQREATLNSYAANYKAAVDNANAAAEIGDVETYNYWVGIANQYAGLYDQELALYNRDLATLDQLGSTYSSAKKFYDDEFARIQAELNVRETENRNAIAAYNALVDEKENQIAEARADAQRRVDELNSIIQNNIDTDEALINEIEDRIKADFGPQYGPFYDVIVKLSQDQDWNVALTAILGLEREGHPLIQRSYEIINIVALNKVAINGLINTYQTQLSQFNVLVQELNNLATNLEALGPEIERLNAELATYIEESLRPIQALEADLAAKEKALAEDVGGRIQSLYTLRDLQIEVIRRQSHALVYVLTTNGPEATTFKTAYDQAKDALLAADSSVVPVDLVSTIAAKSPQIIDELLEVEPYQNQTIASAAILTEDEKAATIKLWWQLLRRENALSEELSTLLDLFDNPEEETWKFLTALFANGFSQGSSIEKIVFVETERPGYRVIADGGTYWINEAGALVGSDDVSSIVFDAVFATPATSAIGKALRDEQAKLKELFKSFEQYNVEQKNALVLAEGLLREADRLESEVEKNKLVTYAKTFGELVVGILPAGDAVDLYECLTGNDIYGDSVGVQGQVLAAAGLFLGSRVFWEKTLNLLSKTYKRLQKILGREVPEVTEIMVQEARVIAENTPIPPFFKATGFISSQKLTKKFLKHANEWGAGVIKTESEYLERALNLMNSKVEGDILGFTSPQGWVFRYNKAANEFVDARPDGLIETFYKPDRGLTYYLEQVEKYGG